jgi:hypothetical protein
MPWLAIDELAGGETAAQTDVPGLIAQAPPRRATVAIAGIAALAVLVMIAVLIAAMRGREPVIPGHAAPAQIPAPTSAMPSQLPPRADERSVDPPALVQASAPRAPIATRDPAPRAVARRSDPPAPAEPLVRELRTPTGLPAHDPHATVQEVAPVAEPPATLAASP